MFIKIVDIFQLSDYILKFDLTVEIMCNINMHYQRLANNL